MFTITLFPYQPIWQIFVILREVKNSKRIPILIPTAPNASELSKYLRKIDRNRRYSNFGPLHSKLVFKFSKYFKIPENNIVLMSSATMALAGAVKTASVKDKIWATPSWTFTATPAAILQGGGTPRFVDIDEKSWRAKFEVNNVNTIDVLPFGDKPRFNFNYTNKEVLIVDAAASFDALKDIVFDHSKSIAYIVSLHATKLISAGEGGIFLTNDPSWAGRVRAWSNFGFKNDSRISSEIGINAKLTEYGAAVGLASLSQWPINRRNILNLSKEVQNICGGFGLKVSPAMSNGFATPYWIIELESKKLKRKLKFEFDKHNIETRDWWGNGCSVMPAYSKFEAHELESTMRLTSTTIGLPFHLHLSKENLSRIKSALSKCLSA
jgi:dTDP-4-amino-4,6-dideoxygalactose transaminase